MTNDLEKKLKHYRLSQDEYNKICQLLGRSPQNVEWALFSALWSEHCSYKSSKIHLKKFAKTMTASVLNSAGENAGVVDLGQGEKIVFKMESHNHPSFIEPYQGAATGVGGILRDIFTMGARPIASADYLCFGNALAPRMQYLVDGVVRGISGYGNSVGVPTVTGQTNFADEYNTNILVNAMAVGLLRPGEPVALSAAQGPGNLVVYVGAKTGKDGVHGAAMASESFDDKSESKKPNVQIGDPYYEKLLIESCLEVIQQKLVVAIQDMGAAGLTSSSFEMSSKGQVGMKLHLDQIPMRDSSLTPEEILLSESQERMLLVCEPEKLSKIQAVFAKWGLDAVPVGEVIKERKVQLFWHNELLTAIDPDLLVENAPVYQRPFSAWKPHSEVELPSDLKVESVQLQDLLLESLTKPELCHRKEIFRQYDQRVGLRTVRGADHDVAVLRLDDSHRGLGVVVGCRPHLMKLDARIGALDAVFYPALQMSIKGLRPIAITDCLNFGNPEKPEIMSEFVASVDAICEASIALKAPVISGNVSFYNETLGKNIISTPAIGMVGLRENIKQIPEDSFVRAGSFVYRLSLTQVFSLGAVVRNKAVKNQFFGELNVQKVAEFCQQLQQLSFSKAVLSNQVVGEGGLALSLVKMAIRKEGDALGFTAKAHLSVDEWIREDLYQTLWEVDERQEKDFLKLCDQLELKPDLVGIVGKDEFTIGSKVQLKLSELAFRYHHSFRRNFESMA